MGNRKIDLDPNQFGKPFSVNAVDCAIMKLRTRVHRNLLKLRQNPHYCDTSKVRREHESVIHRNIVWSGSVLMIHEAYCSPTDERYHVPLKVLSIQDAYMWEGAYVRTIKNKT